MAAVLRQAAAGRLSGAVHLSGPTEGGSVYFENGAAVHATFALERGVGALASLLGLEWAEYRFESGVKPPARSLRDSLDFILRRAELVARFRQRSLRAARRPGQQPAEGPQPPFDLERALRQVEHTRVLRAPRADLPLGAAPPETGAGDGLSVALGTMVHRRWSGYVRLAGGNVESVMTFERGRPLSCWRRSGARLSVGAEALRGMMGRPQRKGDHVHTRLLDPVALAALQGLFCAPAVLERVSVSAVNFAGLMRQLQEVRADGCVFLCAEQRSALIRLHHGAAVGTFASWEGAPVDADAVELLTRHEEGWLGVYATLAEADPAPQSPEGAEAAAGDWHRLAEAISRLPLTPPA